MLIGVDGWDLESLGGMGLPLVCRRGQVDFGCGSLQILLMWENLQL